MKTSATARFTSFFFALVLTMGTLAGINNLAVSDVHELQLARAQAGAKA